MSNELSLQQQKPEWMQQDGKAGTEDMSRYIVPPRLVIKQPLAKGELTKYSNGTVVVMPVFTVLIIITASYFMAPIVLILICMLKLALDIKGNTVERRAPPMQLASTYG